MPFTINSVDVWAADIPNRSGTLARILEGLMNAGADLEFMIARRVNGNTSRVFIAPIKGAKQQRAAAGVGLVRAKGMHSLRIEGPGRVGLGAEITRAVADEGINLRGASAAGIGRKAVFYLALETEQERKAGLRVVRKLLGKKGRS